MDDRWHAYVVDCRLYLHRSWTGYGVFEAQFADCQASCTLNVRTAVEIHTGVRAPGPSNQDKRQAPAADPATPMDGTRSNVVLGRRAKARWQRGRASQASAIRARRENRGLAGQRVRLVRRAACWARAGALTSCRCCNA